jgi:hypothetical protein
MPFAGSELCSRRTQSRLPIRLARNKKEFSALIKVVDVSKVPAHEGFFVSQFYALITRLPFQYIDAQGCMCS